jgi:hypothetical protein
MPNKPGSKHRSVRVSDELWAAADESAQAAGTNRGDVIKAFLRWYTREAGATLPKRPV